MESGELDQKYFIGYVSTRSDGEVHPNHYGLGATGTLWKFVTEDMYELIQAKFGREEGREIYHKTFGWLFENSNMLVDENRTLDLGIARQYQSSLENSLLQIEATVFITSSAQTEDYINHSKEKINNMLPVFEEAIKGNQGKLSNGRTVSQDYVDNLKVKLVEYDATLERLERMRKQIGNWLLSDIDQG
jgi:hypothetical protein